MILFDAISTTSRRKGNFRSLEKEKTTEKRRKGKEEKEKTWVVMKKEKCCGCKQYFPKNRLLFDYCSGNHFCLNCYKNQFTAI